MFYSGSGGLLFLVFFYSEKLLNTLLTFIIVGYNHNAKQKNKTINACKVKMNSPYMLRVLANSALHRELHEEDSSNTRWSTSTSN